MKPSQDITKLPKWAQEYIKDIERERHTAVSALKEWTDHQTPSPLSVSEHVCIGGQPGPSRIERFIQGYHCQIKHAGVSLSVTFLQADELTLQWEDGGRMGREVAFVPTGYQSARLVSKANMRS